MAGLPRGFIAHAELASLDSIFKEVAHGTVAWFTLIHLIESPDTMGAYVTLACGKFGDT